MKRSATVLALVTALLLTAATAAQAAQRYAAPSGSGTECHEAKPCKIAQALSFATTGDEVIIGGGTYPVAAALESQPFVSDLFVHGAFDEPAPTISGSVVSYMFRVSAPGSRISHLNVINSAEKSVAVVCSDESTMERVHATATGKGAFALYPSGACLLRDSVAIAAGEQSFAVNAAQESNLAQTSIRNVTAIGSGPGSIGLRAQGFGAGGEPTVTVRNSIVRGREFDVWATPGGAKSMTLQIAFSNFDTTKVDANAFLVAGPGNQTAPPAFLDPTAGDFREAPGSPTIDAGTADPLLGSTDFEGSPRTLGAAPDIGAFEFTPPALVPPPPPPVGILQSLSLKPKVFRAANVGEAIFSAKPKPKAKAPIGASVAYSISAAGAVDFHVERLLAGRRVGKRCVKQTRANRAKRNCAMRKPVKGGFAHSGLAGPNGFRFAGRIAGKALRPGRYELVGEAGDAEVRAPFRLVG